MSGKCGRDRGGDLIHPKLVQTGLISFSFRRSSYMRQGTPSLFSAQASAHGRWMEDSDRRSR